MNPPRALRVAFFFLLMLLFGWSLAADDPALVAHFLFDERSGTIAADNSQYGIVGTLVNAPVWTAGRVNGALRFDGTNYVNVANTSELNPANAVTIVAWVNPTGTSVSQFIVAKDNLPSGQLQYFLRVQAGGGLRMGIGTNVHNFMTSPSLIVANKWQHVAGVFDGSTIQLYVNAQPAGSVAATGVMSNNGVNVRIGWRQDGALPFRGMIDDVAIYSRALSHAEIQALYDSVVFDALPPTATMTAPANGATVAATIPLSADASDNVGVAGVQFYVDGAKLGAEDTTYPYATSLDTKTLSNGAHQITAEARDAANHKGMSAAVSVTVNNVVADTTPPQVSISSPLAGQTVSGSIIVSADATDNVGVASVQFRVDGAPLGAPDTATPYEAALDTSTLANGTHQLTALAVDTSGNNAMSAAVAITVNNPIPDNTPPLLSNGKPTGTLAAATTQALLEVTTNEPATCHYSVTSGVAFGAMAFVFSTTGGTAHAVNLTGLADGQNYKYYVRCRDVAGNENGADYLVSFDVALPSAGLRAQLLFSEGAGLATADSSGNGNNGTLMNGPVWCTGHADSALRFDGVDDYVDIGNAANLNPTNAITIAAWFNTSMTNVSQYIVGKDNLPTGTLQYFLRVQAGGKLRMAVRTNVENYLTSAPAINANTWYHITGVYDGTSLRLYLNGQLLGAPLAAAGAMANNGVNVRIGTKQDGLLPFKGVLDEVEIYDRALSAPEVLALYQGTPPPQSDTTPPTVSIGVPQANATLSGNAGIEVLADDNVGVERVELYVDGALFGADGAAPHKFVMSTALFANGAHALTARAYDAAGNVASSAAVNVQVSNTAAATRPDIIFILLDDYRYDVMPFMPLTSALLQSESVIFTNAYTSEPVCCPARASILTGLYSHNTGVYENNPPNGSATYFQDASTVATWLQQAGYRTGLFGKYLNGYENMTRFIPPGWSDWHAVATLGTLDFNYSLYENGVMVPYGSQPQDYGTDVIAARTVTFIEQTPAGQPLFAYFSPSNYIAAPRDVGSFANLPPQRPLSYNEADVSDKPLWVRKLPVMTQADHDNVDSFTKIQMEALQSTDRAVAAIVDALKRAGRWERSVIVVTSDNGMSWGEHRIVNKKWSPFEECMRMPLWMRVPGIPGRTEEAITVNVDFAPTFAEWAGVAPSTRVNGYSLVNRLQNPNSPWPEERLYEYIAISGPWPIPERRFHALRYSRYVYVEYENGDREFYDLVADPFQMENKINEPAFATTIEYMKKSLAAIRNL